MVEWNSSCGAHTQTRCPMVVSHFRVQLNDNALRCICPGLFLLMEKWHKTQGQWSRGLLLDRKQHLKSSVQKWLKGRTGVFRNVSCMNQRNSIEYDVFLLGWKCQTKWQWIEMNDLSGAAQSPCKSHNRHHLGETLRITWHTSWFIRCFPWLTCTWGLHTTWEFNTKPYKAYHTDVTVCSLGEALKHSRKFGKCRSCKTHVTKIWNEHLAEGSCGSFIASPITCHELRRRFLNTNDQAWSASVKKPQNEPGGSQEVKKWKSSSHMSLWVLSPLGNWCPTKSSSNVQHFLAFCIELWLWFTITEPAFLCTVVWVMSCHFFVLDSEDLIFIEKMFFVRTIVEAQAIVLSVHTHFQLKVTQSKVKWCCQAPVENRRTHSKIIKCPFIFVETKHLSPQVSFYLEGKRIYAFKSLWCKTEHCTCLYISFLTFD